MRRPLRMPLIILLFPPTRAAVGGWLVSPSFLHPIRRALTPDLIRDADATFTQIQVHPEEFDVHASDGVLLRGCKVRAANPGSSLFLLFHVDAVNRFRVLDPARIRLLS